MATTRPTAPAEEAQPSLPIGTFVDILARGYLEPTGAELAQIQRLLAAPLPTVSPNVDFWNSLYLIKLLAPEESKDLVIFAHATSYLILDGIARSLVLKYYQQGK